MGIIRSIRFSTVLLFLGLAHFAMSARAKSYDNVEYSRAAGNSLQFDAWVPDGAGPFPAVVIVHGGAWVSGDRRRSVEPLFDPLSQAGYAWFSISYRLAKSIDPESAPSSIASLLALGSAVDDVRDAVTYVKMHAPEYHIDPNRVALIGESAGAQLASMAALKPAAGGAVQAVVAFYSPSDLVALLDANPRVPPAMRQAIRESAFGEMLFAGLRDLSPVAWVRKEAPPFLLIHGTRDMLVPFEQSQAMCEAMRTAGASCELYPVDGGGHGLRWWESVPGQTSYKPVLIRWLDGKLRAPKQN